MRSLNGIGVRLAKETPQVWLLLPPFAKDSAEETHLLQSEWKQGQSWWMGWLWWWFSWWNRHHIQRFKTGSIVEIQPFVSELNRILAGDAKCSMYTLGRTDIQEAINHLAPKSTLYVVPLGVLPSQFETHCITELKRALSDRKHPQQWLERPSTKDEWLEVVTTWVRSNLITQNLQIPLKHIVLFMRRAVDNWNGLSAPVDKERYILEQQIQTHFPSCTVQVVINGRSASKTLQQISPNDAVLYGSIDSLQQDSISPALHIFINRDSWHPMNGLERSPLWIRLLRQQIWDATGKAP